MKDMTVTRYKIINGKEIIEIPISKTLNNFKRIKYTKY